MSSGNPIILIADDDLDDQELLEELLLQTDRNCTVDTVMSGREVAQYLANCEQHQLPHLIVLDYNIPDMNGLEIFQSLRSNERLRDIPVVFWSTSTSPLLQAACEEAGARWFVIKPTAISDALALAQRLLALCVKQTCKK